MTRRERIEARLARRREWAASREHKSAQAFERGRQATEHIPLGQPILVGHHSEARHRRAIERSDAGMRAGIESHNMARHHESKADGIEHQLATSIYSDDPDAIEALEAKAVALEAKRDRMKAVNAAFKAGSIVAVSHLFGEEEAEKCLRLFTACPYEKRPYPPYALTNIGATIRAARKRVEEVKRRQQTAAAAEAAPGGVLIQGTGDYVAITFAEKPERSVLEALKAAGFWWSHGSWCGKRENVPAGIEATE